MLKLTDLSRLGRGAADSIPEPGAARPRFSLIPRDERFFDLLERSAANACEATYALAALLDARDAVEPTTRRLKLLEQRSDELTQAIFGALHRTFVTPLDREDITAFASSLHAVVDRIEEVGRRVHRYGIVESTPQARQLASILVEQAELIVRAVPLVQRKQYGDDLQRLVREVGQLEDRADDVVLDAVATCFEGVASIGQVVQATRWADLYQLLDDASDAAEDVADVLRDIAVKEA